MLNWARQTGRIQNRLELTKPHKEKSRSRVLSLEELWRVWISSFELGTFGVIVRLLILTAQRRGEIANIHLCNIQNVNVTSAQINDIKCLSGYNFNPLNIQTHSHHLTSNTTTPNIHLCNSTTYNAISAEKSFTTHQTTTTILKRNTPNNLCATVLTANHTEEATGYQPQAQVITWHAHQTKNRKEHILPITCHTITLFQLLKESSQNSYNTWSKPKAALDKLSGVTNWTLHDLRRSVATHLSKELKVDYLTIEAILNHTPQRVNLGPCRVGWLLSEVEAWIAERAKERTPLPKLE